LMAVQSLDVTRSDLGFLVGAGEGNRTLMTSLEDRYWPTWFDLLVRMRWSCTSADPWLTVTVRPSLRHLARAWPALGLAAPSVAGRATRRSDYNRVYVNLVGD
jgi:hypothetical protein